MSEIIFGEITVDCECGRLMVVRVNNSFGVGQGECSRCHKILMVNIIVKCTNKESQDASS